MNQAANGGDFAEWRSALRAAASRLLGPVRRRADTSDVAQEAVLQIWLQGSNPEDVSKAYLAKVARGHAARTLRFHNQQRRSINREARRADPGEQNSGAATPETILQQRAMTARVAQLVQLLPERQQEVVYQHIFCEKSFNQIASETGLTARAVRYAFSEALESLRRQLEADDLVPGC